MIYRCYFFTSAKSKIIDHEKFGIIISPYRIAEKGTKIIIALKNPSNKITQAIITYVNRGDTSALEISSTGKFRERS